MKNLKLNALASENLSKVEMNCISGGANCCWCACAYANSGGSSTNDNGGANSSSGKNSPQLDSQLFCEK
jgi:natural product precursor